MQEEQLEQPKTLEPSSAPNVWVVTSGQLVLATFDNHDAAIAYCERDDVGGQYGLWSDARHTYYVNVGQNLDGTYRIWNQTVWKAATSAEE